MAPDPQVPSDGDERSRLTSAPATTGFRWEAKAALDATHTATHTDSSPSTELTHTDHIDSVRSEPKPSAPGPTVAERWAVPPWLDVLAGWTWRSGIVAAGVYALFVAFGMLRVVAVPVLFALIFTALLWPARRALVERGVPTIIAAWSIMATTLALIVGAGWLVSVGVYEELTDNVDWNTTRAAVEDWLRTGPLSLTESEIETGEERLRDALTQGLSSVDASPLRTLTEIGGATILTVILVFFFVKDGPHMWQFCIGRVRERRRAAVDRAGQAAFRALTGYARGVSIAGLVNGAAIAIVLTILDVPLALQLGLLTVIGSFIPIVGATVVGLISVVVALVTQGPDAALIVALATFLIQQIEGDVLLPAVMGRQTQLHPAVVLVALAAGAAVAGLIGAFVAVPVAAMAAAGLGAFRRQEPADAAEAVR